MSTVQAELSICDENLMKIEEWIYLSECMDLRYAGYLFVVLYR